MLKVAIRQRIHTRRRRIEILKLEAQRLYYWKSRGAKPAATGARAHVEHSVARKSSRRALHSSSRSSHATDIAYDHFSNALTIRLKLPYKSYAPIDFENILSKFLIDVKLTFVAEASNFILSNTCLYIVSANIPRYRLIHVFHCEWIISDRTSPVAWNFTFYRQGLSRHVCESSMPQPMDLWFQ